jgi:hypothetical protein
MRLRSATGISTAQQQYTSVWKEGTYRLFLYDGNQNVCIKKYNT